MSSGRGHYSGNVGGEEVVSTGLVPGDRSSGLTPGTSLGDSLIKGSLQLPWDRGGPYKAEVIIVSGHQFGHQECVS